MMTGLLAGVRLFRAMFSVTRPLSGIFQAIAFAGRFQDVAVVRQPVQDGAGQSLATEHLGPLLERQVRRHDHTSPFVGRGDHVE